VTIVLTPTRAVTANMVSAAEAAGISVGDWPRGCDAGDASLFVLDMARVVQDYAVFVDIVQRLSGEVRLARVAIDEVHLVLLWGCTLSAQDEECRRRQDGLEGGRWRLL